MKVDVLNEKFKLEKNFKGATLIESIIFKCKKYRLLVIQ